MAKKVLTVFLVLLLLAGSAALLYPAATQLIYQHQERQAVEQFRAALDSSRDTQDGQDAPATGSSIRRWRSTTKPLRGATIRSVRPLEHGARAPLTFPSLGCLMRWRVIWSLPLWSWRFPCTWAPPKKT